jgi:hypothetical protein
MISGSAVMIALCVDGHARRRPRRVDATLTRNGPARKIEATSLSRPPTALSKYWSFLPSPFPAGPLSVALPTTPPPNGRPDASGPFSQQPISV